MRIKKINDDKVQIIITSQDLEDRDFKKWEIIPIAVSYTHLDVYKRQA